MHRSLSVVHNFHASVLSVPLCASVYECAYSDPLLLSAPLSVLHRLFPSYWLPVCKATVNGTPLICHYVKPTAGETVGPPQAAAAVLPRVIERRGMDLLHRTQIHTTLTDMGLLL